MNPEHIPQQNSSEDNDSMLNLFKQCIKENPGIFKSNKNLEGALAYILQFDPESRLEVINEKVDKNESITSVKLTLKRFLKIAKEAFKNDLIIDEKLKKVINDRILRMEVYLSSF